MEELKSMLKVLKNMALWRLEDTARRGITSDFEIQFDAKFNEIVEKAAAIEAICTANRKEDLRISQKLVLGIYLVWSFFMIVATTGIWRIELLRKSAEGELDETNSRLITQAEELAMHRENLAGLVEKRTSELMTANVLLRQEIDNRLMAEATLKESEEQIRALSAQLLKAQEIERRRISMELHDGLGQALNVIKLRLRIVENWLSDEQVAAREDCESLQEYLGEVIEDVRRISWDLSPAILEDLGLTSALRWLVSNFRKLSAMKTTSQIAEIDDLFPENNRITIYRVIQEALTNVGRHSRAKNVSVVIRRDQDRVAFTVEDDGRGFDFANSLNREGSKTGLGLRTMNERVRMMGGDFDLWSREGEGTRISFSVPIGNGGGR
jgi:signal transduction histidine kinase